MSHGNVPSDHFWKICDRCKHHSCNFDFPSTRIENICVHAGSPFGPRPSVKGAIPEKTRLDPAAFYDFIDFHRLWYESLLCHTGRVLEPWRCVKGPFQNNLQPVLKPCWKFQILTHSYRNNDFTIKSQTLSQLYRETLHRDIFVI